MTTSPAISHRKSRMNATHRPLAALPQPPAPPQESAAIDRLLQDYLIWSAEALDVLVSLYEAIDSGETPPPEAARFAARIGAWETQLSSVLTRLRASMPETRDRVLALA